MHGLVSCPSSPIPYAPTPCVASYRQVGAGVMGTLANQHRKEALSIYHRFYRSYIRAFADAKDAAPSRGEHGPLDDDDFVTRSEFRLLLRYLGIYATWSHPDFNPIALTLPLTLRAPSSGCCCALLPTSASMPRGTPTGPLPCAPIAVAVDT